MSAVDEIAALTQSIGEHAVQAIGRDNLESLTVVTNANDMTARIAVELIDNNAETQAEALEELFSVQDLFFEEVSMTFAFGVDAIPDGVQVTGQRQYSYA